MAGEEELRSGWEWLRPGQSSGRQRGAAGLKDGCGAGSAGFRSERGDRAGEDGVSEGAGKDFHSDEMAKCFGGTGVMRGNDWAGEERAELDFGFRIIKGAPLYLKVFTASPLHSNYIFPGICPLLGVA